MRKYIAIIIASLALFTGQAHAMIIAMYFLMVSALEVR